MRSMLFATNIAVEQEVIGAAITIALCTLRMYTNTACFIHYVIVFLKSLFVIIYLKIFFKWVSLFL